MMRAEGDSDLKIYGIFGHPLGHTVSPAIQNCAFDHYKLKSLYFVFERPPERFHYLMRHLKSCVLNGFNITVPYKEAVLPYLDGLSPEAKRVGAVNTVKKQGNRWFGYNTDVHGVYKALQEAKFQIKNKRVLVLGAGGSARAVLFCLARNGAKKVSIANRTLHRARNVAAGFKKLFPKVEWSYSDLSANRLKQVLSQIDLLVNATKIGLKREDPLLISGRLFPKKRILVFDLIYRPQRTKLLQTAFRQGHQTMNGESMLLYQGAKAFEIWTQKEPPVREMRKALKNALASR